MKLSLDDQTTGLVTSRLNEALDSSKLVVCLGSKLELASFCNVEAIRDHVVGGATTTAEAKEIQHETFADFLITDDVTEAGNGTALAIEFLHLKTIVLTSGETNDLVMEAEERELTYLSSEAASALAAKAAFFRPYRPLLKAVCGYLRP